MGILGLVARCSEALASVQRSRQTAVPSSRRPSSVREELLSTLQGGSKKRKWKRKKNVWKHKFMCLAYLEQQVPLREAEKDELFIAGLGEKEIELDLDMNAGMSIVQGGPGFPVLADATYCYITTGEATDVKVSNKDLPLHLKNVVDQVA